MSCCSGDGEREREREREKRREMNENCENVNLEDLDRKR